MSKKTWVSAALCVAFVVAATTPALAQTQVSWSAGPKAGLNMAKLFGSDAEDIDEFRYGFVGGGFIRAQMHENFAIQAEALYTQKGGKATEGSNEFKATADYIEIPVMAMGLFPAGDKATVTVMAGPAISFLTTAKLDENGTETDVKDDTKSVDFGIQFGVGVDIEATETVIIMINAGYNLGLMKIDDSDAGLDIKNGVLGLTAGVAFPFGGGGS
jgi:opacity protein-like surface antigen